MLLRLLDIRNLPDFILLYTVILMQVTGTGLLFWGPAGVRLLRSRKAYLVGAEKMVAQGAFDILLSHNPGVFPMAAQQGCQLTIAFPARPGAPPEVNFLRVCRT